MTNNMRKNVRKNKEKLMIVVSVLAILGFLFIFTTQLSETSVRPSPRWYAKNRMPTMFLSPMLLIVGVVPVSYYFVSKKLEDKMEKNIRVISKLVSKTEKSKKTVSRTKSTIIPKGADSKDIILKFLNFNERKVVKKLIETDGTVLQSEINRVDGMTKLKTHRSVKDLEKKGVIVVESHGKTNRITLSKDIKDILLE